MSMLAALSTRKRYVVRRAGQAGVVLVLLSLIVFGIARLSGNPVDVMLPPDTPPAVRAGMIHQFGLDRSPPSQYVAFVSNALQGNFGQSTRFQMPAMRLVLQHLPATLELGLTALLIAIVVGVTVGMFAATRQGSVADGLTRAGLTVGQALPSFWLAILLILVFGVKLRWLPFIGQSGPQSFVLPALTLALLPTVTIARVTRSAMIAVISQDYVRTARSKGLPRGAVLLHHVARNGLIPVVTVTGVLTAELLSGAVITEQIFAWPGIGSLAIQAIEARDYPVVQAVTLLTATMVIVINLAVDFSYLWIDPRIRIGAR